MRALGIEPPSVMLTGGGARGELWRTILAAQLRVPLATGTAAEGPALGAAILAQVGGGVAPTSPRGRRRGRPADRGGTADPGPGGAYRAAQRATARSIPR